MAVGVALSLLSAGCAATAPDATPIATNVSAAAVPADPVAAFAATAAPGAETQLTLANGGVARARLQRAYIAASGRECREVLLGFGLEERGSVVCRDPEQGWMPARPLLRGAARP